MGVQKHYKTKLPKIVSKGFDKKSTKSKPDFLDFFVSHFWEILVRGVPKHHKTKYRGFRPWSLACLVEGRLRKKMKATYIWQMATKWGR
jgi:hypothetical protein